MSVNDPMNDVYQKLKVLDTSEDDAEKMFIAGDVVSTVVSILHSNKQRESIKSTSLNERQCTLTQGEKEEIRNIVRKLFNTLNVSGYSILKQALMLDNNPKEVLDILRFFARNKFFDDVKYMLVHGGSHAMGITLSVE